MKITEFSVDRPITTSMIVSIVIVVSSVALSRLPIDLMPDVTFPSMSVSVSYRGATPEEIETLITRPLEEAMGSVENIEEIVTTSSEDRSVARLQFRWGTDLDVAANDVRERLDRMRGAFPDEVDPPVLYKFDVNQRPVLRFGLAATALPPQDLRHLAEHTLKPRLERAPGVASVEIGGGRIREIQVNLSQEKLDALKLAPQTIVQAIRSENLNLPAGEVFSGETQLVMRTKGQFIDPSEFQDIVVDTRDGVPIYLRDVAEVVDGLNELREVDRINGVPGIRLEVFKQSGSNTVSVADATFEEIEAIKKDYPFITVVTLSDSAKFIRDAINNVKSAAITGSVLAIIILLIFLRDIKATLIIASSIPISVMASFALIYFSDFTLNIVSFGGLALGIGMLVDSSIVVLENIYRHRDDGQGPRTAAIVGTKEVTTAIIASTLTTLVVFLPLLFLSGAASIMFTQLAYVVAFSLSCSLIVSFTIVPSFARRMLLFDSDHEGERESVFKHVVRASERGFAAIDNAYRRVLRFALSHRLLVVTVSCSLFVMALPIYNTLGFEYMPQTDEGEVRLWGMMAPGTRLETMDAAFTEMEQLVQETVGDEVANMSTNFGMSSWFGRGGSSSGRIELQLKPDRVHSSEEIADILRPVISTVPGVRANARPGGGLFIFRMLSPEGESINVEIRGYDQVIAREIADEVKERLSGIEGVVGAQLDDAEGRPEIGLEIDRYKAAEAGFTVTSIAQNIRTNFGGEVATRFRDAGDEFDVLVRLQEDDRQTIKDLRTHWLTAPSGERIPASNFLTQVRTTGPTEIQRLNQQRVLTVDADLDPEYALGNVMKEVEASLGQMKLPEGFTLFYGGEYEEQQKSFRELTLGIMMAVLLVYMVMAAQFESFLQPFIIMFSIPFATIGVFGMMWITETTMSVQSFLGMIVLVGIVVNNAIVLVDYTNLLRREHGFALHEAVTEGGRRRLRPILMTTLTTVLALIPMCFGYGSGAELQAPMARVIFGGMVTSTLITLVLIPVLYTTLEEVLERRATKRVPVKQAAPSDSPIPAK